MNPEVAFVIIKPDAIERGLIGEVFSRIERMNMRILGLQERQKTLDWAEQHYEHLKDKPYFEELCRFMCTRPIIGFNVAGVDAVKRLRRLAGATDSREAAPGTLRGDYGTFPVMYNVVHVSDSPEAADRERGLFYEIDTTVLAATDEEEG